MPGVVQHSLESLPAALEDAAAAGIGGVMLFGVPEHKDARGSGGVDPNGILNLATAVAVKAVGDALVVQTDLCLDEFTDHGHCGVLAPDGSVDNDATLDVYCEMALAQATAGSQLLGLSGMMDGQVAAVRDALDAAGHTEPADSRVLGQVRVGVLRAVPRGRAVFARPATAAPTSWTRRTGVKASERSNSTSQKAPTS